MNQYETEQMRKMQEDEFARSLGSAGNKCLTKGCMRPPAPALKRGLCMPCYSAAKKMVDAGKTTWIELVALGVALDADAADLFTKSLEEARKNQCRP